MIAGIAPRPKSAKKLLNHMYVLFVWHAHTSFPMDGVWLFRWACHRPCQWIIPSISSSRVPNSRTARVITSTITMVMETRCVERGISSLSSISAGGRVQHVPGTHFVGGVHVDGVVQVGGHAPAPGPGGPASGLHSVCHPRGGVCSAMRARGSLSKTVSLICFLPREFSIDLLCLIWPESPS